MENRAVDAEAELMEIEERKLDERIALDKKADQERKKKTEGEFTGINEIADETVVGGPVLMQCDIYSLWCRG